MSTQTNDTEAVALALHRREYAEFNPEPVFVAQATDTRRQSAWRALRKLMVVCAGALLLLSALNTLPVFYHMMGESDWGFLRNVVAFVQGGAAVLGYEIFLLSTAMMLRLLPKGFPGIGWVRFAFVLAFLGGLIVNQDALIAPLVNGQVPATWWATLKAFVLGAGRFVLMVGAGEAVAVIVMGEDHADTSGVNAYQRAIADWNAARQADWRARSASYRARAARMVEAGAVPSGLLEAGNDAVAPFALTTTNSLPISSNDSGTKE